MAEGVFSVWSSISIDAPIDEVWRILLDFPSYPEWNPYIRSQVLIDDSNESLPDQHPAEGKRLLQSVYVLPTTEDISKASRSLEILTHVDHRKYHLAWRFASPAHCLFRAERWQTLRMSSSDGTTRYETWEVFSGLLAHPLQFFMRDKLEEAFEAMTVALKARAEESDEKNVLSLDTV